jgi:hypothetical protein
MNIQQINDVINPFEVISLDEMDRVKLMNRIDTKFAFSFNELLTILPELSAHYTILEVDKNKAPFYESLYLDDTNFSFFHDHHKGKSNRFKVRFRKYVDSQLTFLEVKHKTKGRTDKKRIAVEQVPNELNTQHTHFVHSIINTNATLHPVMWNSFHRITLVSKLENERLTFDFSIQFKWGENQQAFDNLVIAELKQKCLNRNSAFYALMKQRMCRPYRLSKYCIGSIELYGESNLKFNRFKKKLLKLKKINTDAS